jgi:beta-galactosidase
MTAPVRIHFGAAYYPEHWPEERWVEDIRLMREAGLSVVRMAEFAWSTLEPAPGEFNFGWLDRTIDRLAANDIVSVLGTPTAAPPAWLVQQCDDIVAVDEHGRPVQFGNRAHYCVNSAEFHDATRRIVAAMAEHFGPNPNVIGWQLDNEYYRVCYCYRCRAHFQRYLTAKFGTLETLNRHWTTAYTSQTYSAWEQITIPIGHHNPGLMLEFRHFVTHSYRGFQQLQAALLRPHLRPEVWITHNFMNFMRWFDGYDPYTLSEDLDIVALDWYLTQDHNDYFESAAVHDLTRGFKRQNFWLMETQPGMVNWKPINNVMDKGEARSRAWQAVAHGADSIVYWQWRSALGGQEQYHGTLVDPSGQPRPFYAEAQQLGRELAAVSGLLTGTAPASRVAMLMDFDSRWAIQWQPHHRDFDYVTHFMSYYRALGACNVGVDILPASGITDVGQLAGYKLILAPALLFARQGLVGPLQQFVSRGGHLVVTLRTGVKDDYNALLPARPPGPLAELAGVEVEEYYALLELVPVHGNWFKGEARIWAERLKLRGSTDTQVIARYGTANGWLDGHVAITVKAGGRGLVYYVGAYLDADAQQALVDRVLASAGVRGLATPLGVEWRARLGPNKDEVYFVINHTRSEQTVTLPWPAHDHLTGQPAAVALRLDPYGVALLTRGDGSRSNPRPG